MGRVGFTLYCRYAVESQTNGELLTVQAYSWRVYGCETDCAHQLQMPFILCLCLTVGFVVNAMYSPYHVLMCGNIPPAT